MIRLTSLLFLFLPTLASAQSMCLCLRCMGPEYDRYAMVAGSMKPTFEIDQCLIFRTTAAPQPGDVITFRHPTRDEVWVKRLIAVAGQTVQMIDGSLFIDGTAVPSQSLPDYIQSTAPEGPNAIRPLCPPGSQDQPSCAISRLTETLGGTTYQVLDTLNSRLDNTALYEVPPGHVFVMGDHRDNSADSRLPLASGGIGFIPVENIIGIFDGLNE